jgi:nicotinate-nucleotide adenylyltransferase
MPKSKLVALFGGTFDPVHQGHRAIADSALDCIDPGRLIVLPAGNPYQRGRMPLASAADRVAMLQLEFSAAGHGRISIDKRELNRIGPTYTVHTLLELRAELGEAVSLVWLIGADAFSHLDTWQHWPQLFELCHFAIARRTAGPHPDRVDAGISPALAAALESRHSSLDGLATAASGLVAELDIDPPPVSSTEVRRRCARGESLRGLVSDAVCDYIERYKLYSTEEI